MTIVFHCLDILTRDQIITRENDGQREVKYSEIEEEDITDKKVENIEQREFLIHLFGKTSDGKTIRVDVQGFRPYFYIRIPGDVETAKKNKGKCIQYLKDYLSFYCKSVPLKFLSIQYCEKKLFYGYTANKLFPFIKIDTPSLEVFRQIKNAFINKFGRPETRSQLKGPWGSHAPEVYEANLDPMLRFIHERNLQPCGWMSIPKEYITSEENNMILADVEWEDVSPAVAPAPTGAFKVASWDIETYSSTGDFPVAKKDYSKVAKNMYQQFTAADVDAAIEFLISRFYGDKALTTRNPLPKRELVEKRCRNLKNELELYLADDAKERRGAGSAARNEEALEGISKLLNSTLGQTMPLQADPIIQIGTTIVTGVNGAMERHIFVQPSCAPVEGAVLHVSRNERELILDWCKWIVEVDPDILIGYNIFGFDERYVWDRAIDLGITVADEVQGLNRLIEFGSELKLKEQRLSSSALGDNFLYMWTTEGRLQVDLLHYIRRIAALPSYKLDFVTGHYMSGKIQSVEALNETPDELSLQVKGGVGDARPGRAVVLLDENGEPVTEKMEVISVEGKSIRLRVSGNEAINGSEERITFLADLDDAEKWAIVKDDLPPQDIFKCHEGSDEDRAKVAKYCVQDCDLVMELYKKLDVFTNSMAMSNVCSVPIGYIFTRGQGIKIESLMFKEAAIRNQVIIVMPSPSNFSTNEDGEEVKQEDSYEGAIVLDPDIGLHKTPVGVADFASLYPSTIVSENISHDMIVWVKDYTFDGKLIEVAWGSDEYDGLSADICRYTDIEFDLLRPDPKDKRKNPQKIAVGRRICRYAQPTDNSKGTVPQIIQQLLAARKAKRNEAAKETDPLRAALLDTEQNAYKITANSLYGQLGSRTFKIRLQHLAASVTSYGRKQIMFAKEVIEEFYGPTANDPRCKASCEAKVVYGDSVTGDTALFIKKDGTNPETVRIDELFMENNKEWKRYHDTKHSIDMSELNINVWTENGFTKIKRIIRHKLLPTKKLFRILTHTGIVDATEDHSIILKNGQECSPNDINIGTELLHNHKQHEKLEVSDTTIDENEAWVMGFFMADGSADVYNCPSGKKASWAINKLDKNLLELARTKCKFQTKILDTVESSGVYKLVPINSDTTAIAERYRNLFYNNHREKVVPNEIINSPINVVQSFWDGFYAGDGDKDINGYCRFDQKGKQVCTGLYLLARKLGYNVSINDRESKQSVFRLTMTKKTQRKNTDAIKVLRELPHPGDAYVYDLETDNHHFAVGPGALVVHNTDSLFVTFSPRDPHTGAPLEGRAAREAVIALTEEAGHLVTQALKPPHDFEFDKVFDPLLMFSKKRYAGRMYESNPDDFVYKYMGIALKRRDNAPIVKMIYGAAMRKVLDEQDVNGAQAIIKQGCMDLVKGKYGFGPLTITKSLRADYADPARIAHKALADRMTARDPGNAPASGDRIPYIYVMPEAGQQASKLQGDRIEHPQYIRDNNLKPDYEYYIHRQLTNPIAQMFAILLENMVDFKRSMLPKEYKELTDDKKMTVRESIASDLLFREALQKCSAEQQKAFITKHFGFAPTVKSGDGPAMKRVTSNNSLEQQQLNPKQSSILSYFSTRDLDAALIKTRQTTRKKAQAQTETKAKK